MIATNDWFHATRSLIEDFNVRIRAMIRELVQTLINEEKFKSFCASRPRAGPTRARQRTRRQVAISALTEHAETGPHTPRLH